MKAPHFKIDDGGIFTGFDYGAANDAEDASQSENGLKWLNGDDAADNAKPAEYLINGILETEAHGMLFGASMSFKTFIALHLAFSICTGKSFFKHQVFTIGKVLYICGEGKGGLSRRLRAIKLKFGSFNNNFFILEDYLSVDDDIKMEKLKKAIKQIKPALIIIDTFSTMATDTDENSNNDVAKALRLIKSVCENSKTSSLTLHHNGKDNSTVTSRGASAFKNNIDYEFNAMRVNTETMLTTLSCIKMKDGETFKPIVMKAHSISLGFLNQDGTESTSLILMDTDEIPKDKSKGIVSLDDTDNAILKVIAESIVKDGFLPPDEVVDYCSKNSINCPENIITKNLIRQEVYALLLGTTDVKKTSFTRCLEKLVNNNKCIKYKDLVKNSPEYLWINK